MKRSEFALDRFDAQCLSFAALHSLSWTNLLQFIILSEVLQLKMQVLACRLKCKVLGSTRTINQEPMEQFERSVM